MISKKIGPMTVEVNDTFIDPGVTVSDNYWGVPTLAPRIVTTSNVNVHKVGTYTVTYTGSDSSHNQAKPVVRVVNVVDTLAPVLTLIGALSDSVVVFKVYNDPGVSYTDNYNVPSNPVVLTVTGSFYAKFAKGTKANVLGAYTIIYTVTDASGNKASITRTVKVVDHVAPVFTLLGPSTTVTVCRWFNYVDAGYTVTDNYDPSASITVQMYLNGVPVATLDGATTNEGVFSLRYSGTDLSKNVGWSEYRYVLVLQAETPTCTSGIVPGLGLDKYINVYPNPNNGVFTVSANLPQGQEVRMTVLNMLGQEVAVINNGILSQNRFQVDLSNQASGIYMLNIVSGNQTLTKRIEIAK